MKNITGKEAKKHVAEALKIVFPGFKFSLRSSFDEVLVSWTDGPLEQDVQRVLNRFESYTRVLWITDSYKCTGYEWHGIHYAGPQYLNVIRTLSESRKEVLIESAGTATLWNNMNKLERVEIERELIRTGKLESVEPRHCPDLLIDEKPVIDNRPKKQTEPESQTVFQNNVVQLFPKPTLTAEQQLKAHILEELHAEKVSHWIQAGDGGAIDLAFTLVAEQLFSKSSSHEVSHHK